MCLDGAVDDGKAEATASILCRHERLEHPRAELGRDAGPVVGDAECHGAMIEAGTSRDLVRRQGHDVDVDAAAVRRGLHRVQREVEDRPMQEVLVGLDDERVIRNRAVHDDAIGARRVRRREVGGATCDCAEVDRLDDRRARPGEIEELAEKARESIRYADDEPTEDAIVLGGAARRGELLDGTADRR